MHHASCCSRDASLRFLWAHGSSCSVLCPSQIKHYHYNSCITFLPICFYVNIFCFLDLILWDSAHLHIILPQCKYSQTFLVATACVKTWSHIQFKRFLQYYQVTFKMQINAVICREYEAMQSWQGEKNDLRQG